MRLFREVEQDEEVRPTDICLHPLINIKIREIKEPVVTLIQECCRAASVEIKATRAKQAIGQAIIDSGK